MIHADHFLPLTHSDTNFTSILSSSFRLIAQQQSASIPEQQPNSERMIITTWILNYEDKTDIVGAAVSTCGRRCRIHERLEQNRGEPSWL